MGTLHVFWVFSGSLQCLSQSWNDSLYFTCRVGSLRSHCLCMKLADMSQLGTVVSSSTAGGWRRDRQMTTGTSKKKKKKKKAMQTSMFVNVMDDQIHILTVEDQCVSVHCTSGAIILSQTQFDLGPSNLVRGIWLLPWQPLLNTSSGQCSFHWCYKNSLDVSPYWQCGQ